MRNIRFPNLIEQKSITVNEGKVLETEKLVTETSELLEELNEEETRNIYGGSIWGYWQRWER